MRARTNSDVHSFSRNFRAVARSISWSALNPKSMRLSWVGGPEMAPHTPQRSARPGKAVARLDHASLPALRQPEHAPADDARLVLGRRGHALRGVRPEVAMVAGPAMHASIPTS